MNEDPRYWSAAHDCQWQQSPWRSRWSQVPPTPLTAIHSAEVKFLDFCKSTTSYKNANMR